MIKACHAICALATMFVTACVSTGPIQSGMDEPVAYAATEATTLAARFAPVIISDNPLASYNRVGAPVAAYDRHGEEHIYVTPEQPLFFFQQTRFTTAHASYTNLIYRIHFEGIPFSLMPFHLTAGNNVGLFIIITIDEHQRPLLITTVHTCGCYLAFTPTSNLPGQALPENWNREEQHVFGQILPGMATWRNKQSRAVIFLQDGTHRVRDIQFSSVARLQDKFRLIRADIQPMDTLRRLAIGSDTTSFYETHGARKGYVKGAHKPWEFLLMSWWTLDAHIGEDKAYGDAAQTGVIFYTDLNPARREASDMWPFARFLEYWGWHL